MLDHAEIRENVFRAIDNVELFILRNLKKAARVNPDTGRREEQYQIPYLAIREAVSDAVAHRDYRIPGNIDVAIFDNRVEVRSPGSLPQGVTIRDIKSKKRFSVPRNPENHVDPVKKSCPFSHLSSAGRNSLTNMK